LAKTLGSVTPSRSRADKEFGDGGDDGKGGGAARWPCCCCCS